MRRVALEVAEERVDVGGGVPEVQVLGLDEAQVDAPLELGPERVEVAVEVEDGHGLVVVAELLERHDLQDLLQRAQAARQRHEGVPAGVHDGLAVAQPLRDDQLGHVAVPHAQVQEGLGDHAGGLTAMRQHRARQRAHEPHAAPAVDEPPAAPGELGAQLLGGGEELAVHQVARAAEDGDGSDHQKTVTAAIIRRR